eukprot:Trichotokara_eunicae@DN6624_c0_g1_i1.p1
MKLLVGALVGGHFMAKKLTNDKEKKVTQDSWNFRVYQHYPSRRLPGLGRGNAVMRSSYITHLGTREKIPLYVAESVTMATQGGPADRANIRFWEDNGYPRKFRPGNGDFWDSG